MFECCVCGKQYEYFDQVNIIGQWPAYYVGWPPSFLGDPNSPEAAYKYFCGSKCATEFFSKENNKNETRNQSLPPLSTDRKYAGSKPNLCILDEFSEK